MSTTTLDLAPAAGRSSQGVRRSAMEVATSIALALIGAAAIWDSSRLGAGWGAEGPQSGYFPFWIGLILAGTSLASLVPVLRARGAAAEAMFVTWPQLRLVMSVLIPTVFYVAAIPLSGIYLASAALVAYFMTRLGEFTWRSALPAAAATALVAFVTFEVWFLVGLPKGPIEELLGF
ncbi:tripartite tricarboxylate transporter TctB family protein [Roseicella sp. DB1501]|uniref:tripartite tricarboxylate transporter TctB family protein n=1 Tax=Roseicella sp. DB1501 TaxID=2730925 RepID=UPI001492558E|nr:tripartite tricarboxylate transporter TctB family protein [Roseicella sp. DB1501]NOG74084.1 tripartite tricarboxylate transporter TctB family protein [Roseicella sp. DB1501]